VQFGTGKIKSAWDAQKDGLLIIKIFVYLFLINVQAVIKLVIAKLAIRDMILRMVNAFTLIQTMPSPLILVAEFGIGIIKNA
jgi:hypothetical protein